MTLYRVAAHAASAPIDDGLIIMDVLAGVYIDLNDAGTLLWRLFETGGSIEDGAALLAEEFEVELSAAASDCRAFVAELANRGLLVVEEP